MNLDLQTLLILFIGGQVLLMVFKAQAKHQSYTNSKPFVWMWQRQNQLLNPALQALEMPYGDKVRLYNLWLQIERLKREKIEGSFAELGVYKGETARLIHTMDPSRTFHLFDTFTGFEESDLKQEIDHKKYPHFSDTSSESIQRFMKGHHNVVFHVGNISDTLTHLPEQTFALVHLDMDLYGPTLKACQYFYPRLAEGGILLVHDYNHHNWPGIRRALDEFRQTIPENLIEVPDMQGSVMIIKNSNRMI